MPLQRNMLLHIDWYPPIIAIPTLEHFKDDLRKAIIRRFSDEVFWRTFEKSHGIPATIRRFYEK